MRIVGFTCLHYGVDYLEYAIRSVIDHVDEHWVVYSPIGSHGHRTDRPCPDTQEQLYAAARRGAGDKLRWVSGEWSYEGAHRGMIHQLAPDADCIIVVDADEVWPQETIETVMYQGGAWMGTFEQRQNGGVSRIRIPMIHFWRSFHRAILHDPAFPVRVIFPKVNNTDEWTANVRAIAHLGYAQRPEIVEYKQHTHGHKGEWDWSWFDNVFMDESARTNLHPVGSEYWTAEEINPWDYLPAFMKSHPFAKMDIIR